MGSKLLGRYKNGNYTVSLYEDGTKIRENDLDYFEADTVESMDIKITNCCDMGCSMCHENSTPDGRHGDILSPSFLDKLHPYCELAIGGGNPLEHPDLEAFLLKCRGRKHIANITVNQVHFEKSFKLIKRLHEDKLIYGVGVSLVDPTPKFIQEIKQIPSAVIHVINGIASEDQLRLLKDNNLKVLFLGYKEVRRGKTLYSRNSTVIEAKKEATKALLPQMINEGWFKVLSFDNLALRQLNVKTLLSTEEWEEFYMGDDGIDGEQTSATFFVDMVKREFARNSCCMERYPIKDTAEEMLQFLQRI